ncbi:MAG: hypothetical protein AB7F32_01220 [Victivallaceae bacterium]
MGCEYIQGISSGNVSGGDFALAVSNVTVLGGISEVIRKWIGFTRPGGRRGILRALSPEIAAGEVDMQTLRVTGKIPESDFVVQFNHAGKKWCGQSETVM